MQPVISTVNENALQPYINEQISAQEALAQTAEPFHTFMLSQTRESDIALFAGIAGSPVLNGPEDVPFSILVPAFINSELKKGFHIGFLIFISFLVDAIVMAIVLIVL